MKQKFIEAVARWYAFVGKDHHKDSDCHFDIGLITRYSYDGTKTEQYWLAEHHGYITDFEETANTEEAVMEGMIACIDDFIKRDGKK